MYARHGRGCGERMKKATIELPRSANRGRRLMLPDSDCPFSSLKRLGMKGAEGACTPSQWEMYSCPTLYLRTANVTAL